ncbi:MAG TPA: hypothetical protein VKU40_05795, partial [Thermoanaerobaculia bacterium]|nr:hypothetical protein [Thermoanaerobaculia bacterium]
MHDSPSSLAARVRFLRDCYRVESQGDSLLDLFARKVEQRRFLVRDHLVSGELEVAPVARYDFEPLAKAARLYAREKRLVYFSLPLVARAGADGALLCAPLVFTAASLDDGRFGDDQLALSLDAADLRFNETAWRAWRSGEGLADPDDEEAEVAGPADDGDDGDDGGELLESILPPPPWREAGELLAALGGVPDLDVSAVAGFPALVSEQELRRAVGAVETGGGARVLPVSGLALVPRSLRTRGILFEL